MLKMMWIATEKKYFLKDARYSGHQMKIVMYKNFFFSVKDLEKFHHSEIVQSHSL